MGSGVQRQNRPMHNNDVARVLAAEGVSNFGAMLSRLAIPWLAALVLLATPLQMAALLVADVAAGAIAALALGGWVDRSGKRAVMLLCDGLRCTLLGLLAIGLWQGWLGFWLLVSTAAASGVITMAFELARSAWMAQALQPAELPRRNSQLALVTSLSETASFALGGWLYQWLGAALALALDAASYAASALCLRGVREVPGATSTNPARGAWRRMLADAAAGLRAVLQRPALRALTGIEVLLAFASALTGTSYMIFVSRDLGLPTGELGMIFALGGLGSVLGASLAPRLGSRLGPGRAMAWALVAFALGAACIPLASGAGWLAVAWLVAHQIVGDAGRTLYNVHDRSLRQTAVPAELLARTDAGMRSAGQSATLAGALLGGVLGTALGTREVLWLATLLAVAAAALAALRLGTSGRKAHGASAKQD